MTTHPMVDDDRERAAALVLGAVDDGRIDLQDAGRLLSSTYRARSRRELDALVGRLTLDRTAHPVTDDRATYLLAAVHIVFFAAAAAVMLIAVLHGINPLDPH
jgi:hypothetical protein